ncbi:MAG: hypothetical protein IPH72_26625 [Sandaracinaceae bacterium]|nr:hypothetical protein [Sandaracinaceae bacterium]
MTSGDMGSVDDGGGDATTDAGMVECEVEDPDMLGSETTSVFQRLAITSRANDFAVVFRERRVTVDDLWVRVYRDTPGGVVAGTDYAITTDASGMPVASESRDPAVVATDTGYLAADRQSRARLRDVDPRAGRRRGAGRLPPAGDHLEWGGCVSGVGASFGWGTAGGAHP